MSGVRVIVFNATFNNISVISWLLVLLVEETGVPGENHRPVFEPTTLVVIGTHCIGSCKSNYHTITTTTAHVARCITQLQEKKRLIIFTSK
jgi:hypothetical protein